jgi:hypothetical protein
VAEVKIEGDVLAIKLSLFDRVLAFHGSFHIPFSHIVNAYVSELEDLQLEYEIEATNFGLLKTSGVFASPEGLIFVDVGSGNCLVIETRGERFPKIAVQLRSGDDPNALAHAIMAKLPDSGPIE